jgi:hypothetical protein
MPRYKSNKEVWALKIKSIGAEKDGGATLHFVEESLYGPRKTSSEYVQKHNPKPGGYFVVYKDGYESWSPAKAFEEGYRAAGWLDD